MNVLSGRHWVFIIGFIAALVVSIWSEHAAENIIILLFFIGLGLFLKDIM